MARAQGSRAQLLGKKNASAYGTAPSGNYVKLPFITSDLGAEQPLISDDTLGNGREPRAPSRDVITEDGSIDIPVDLRNIGFWLTALLGSEVVTGEEAPYTHTWKSGATALADIALEVGHPEVPSYAMHLGCLVDSMAFSLTPSGLAKATVKLIGQAEILDDASGGGMPTSLAYRRFSQFQGSIKKDGSALASVTDANFTIMNHVDPVRVIRDDGLIEGGDLGENEISGKITVRFGDTALLDLATSGDSTALELAYTIDASNKLVFTIPEVYLPRAKRPVTGPGGIQADFNWQAAKNTVAGYSVQAQLLNDVASY